MINESSNAMGVFHVNDREGRVAVHGEDLTGKQILERVGLSVDRYDLFTLVDGKPKDQIGPDQTQFVKPGSHFRATLKGLDYSCGGIV